MYILFYCCISLTSNYFGLIIFFFQGIPDLPAEVAAEPAESAEPQEHGEQPQGEGGDKTPVSGSLLNN